jgi:hypothetical protein
MPIAAHSDEFERLEGTRLREVASKAKPHALTFEEIPRRGGVLPGTRVPLVLVETAEGNLGKLLVNVAFRKRSSAGEPGPVFLIERFETLSGRDGLARLARGKELLLFEGFSLDVDTGQVVPEGFHEDLRARRNGEGKLVLEPVGGARMLILERIPERPQATVGPSPGRAILPSDFGGRFHLNADGRTTGPLEIVVSPEGEISGRFRSDATGGVYAIKGELIPGAPERVRFEIEFPRSRQVFEGSLFSEGKGVLAGLVDVEGRRLGFVAVRDGYSIGSPAAGRGSEEDPTR